MAYVVKWLHIHKTNLLAMANSLKVLGKIDLETGKLLEGDPNILGIKDSLEGLDSFRDGHTKPHKPVDHSGTCSSCGGHSYYGYCDRCDDLF